MKRILHLSDLHLGQDPVGQVHLFESLVEAVRALSVDLVVFTGDVFDSSTLPAEQACDEFLALLSRIRREVGEVPALVLPGNHDRRDAGLVAPFDGALFAALAARARTQPNLTVLGGHVPFLAHRVTVPGLAAHVVAYDSTYLPRGLLSAGGVLRQEDLLEVGEQLLPFAGDGLPLLFLVHHHLVPTPVTDTGTIDVSRKSPLTRFLVRHVLPELVAFGDHEELTMTAMGAGTALSTLHSLGRPVVVLHGHKHYPTARLLKGLEPGDGDVLLLAAGSCGTSEAWQSAPHSEAPRLWPSFNVVELDGEVLRARSVAFPPARDGRTPAVVKPRPLAVVRQVGLAWDVARPEPLPPPPEPTLTLNEAVLRLVPSQRHLDRLDVVTTRRVDGGQAEYQELVEGPPGARLEEVRVGGVPLEDVAAPATLQLPDGREVSYRLSGGVCASLDAAAQEYGVGWAYEWVGLLNRYRCALTRLRVGLGPVDPARQRPFASATDLTTGKERVVELQRDDAQRSYVVELRDCPARTLLRVTWPLAPRPG
ncbi:MAG: metallophosphoesterase [Myxococcaceae bacterium]|nr:metallophosphoesterase [Myxococcaceae bacterium]